MSELTRSQVEKATQGLYDTTILIKKGNVTFNLATRRFVAEASDIQANGQTFTGMLGSIVTLTNERTKKSMTFMCAGPKRDRECEITHWDYTPCKSSEENFYNVKGLVIYND